jgi:peptidoglycan biosynthesis protein MviN/MurJ (putative lipid II flippase)
MLFERGAFTAQDTALVTDVFRWGVLQIPFYFTGLVLVQLLASQGRYTIIAVLAASNLAVKVLLNLSLSAWMGVAGIALATGVMYAWSAGCLGWAAMRQVTK